MDMQLVAQLAVSPDRIEGLERRHMGPRCGF